MQDITQLADEEDHQRKSEADDGDLHPSNRLVGIPVGDDAQSRCIFPWTVPAQHPEPDEKQDEYRQAE
jgi:hypothetical protein